MRKWTHIVDGCTKVRVVCEARGMGPSFSGANDGLDDWVVVYEILGLPGEFFWRPLPHFRRTFEARDEKQREHDALVDQMVDEIAGGGDELA